MAIGQYKDVENGCEIVNSLEVLEKPFIQQEGKFVGSYHEDEDDNDNEKGSLWMVLLCTFVAVCGSFEFGSCEPKIIQNKKKKVCLAQVVVLAGGIFSTHTICYQ
ncbi:hypothetical protein Dsin_029401 [Dipteronia sinensis]|uniref:Uncharacterized protein n=1 Tax=Dipteronia sinensis TaxID=43782 RepID=A0AAD9ZSF2_9ROSI|nr:hypothetical protein Dsin_029401 [Dipteronia sinensis]